MLYVNLHKYASGSGFPRTMNVNERKIKTNSMNNHNVKIPDLIHKYNRGLRQATEI